VGKEKGVGSHEDIERGLADAGWELDGSFSEHLAIGYDGDLSILIDLLSWDGNHPAYALYDAQRHLSLLGQGDPDP
jgi:hypothetical protein